MRPPFTFGDGHGLRPSRAWAQLFVDGCADYYLSVLADYRERVAEYHSETARTWPEFFVMLEPTLIRVVCSLAGIWTFARSSPSGIDEVFADERWETDVLASPDILIAPNPERIVRGVLDLDDEWRMVSHDDLRGFYETDPPDPFRNKRVRGLWMEGWIIADDDASTADIHRMVTGLAGRSLDRSALAALAGELTELRLSTNPQARGAAFERWFERVLAAHGCVVEHGKHISGEQVDLFVHRPFRALVECRWEHSPIGVDAIAQLSTKLRRERPSIVIGVYVSMSGFTETATIEARRLASDRVVLLVAEDDVGRVLSGSVHVADLVDERLDALVRRY